MAALSLPYAEVLVKPLLCDMQSRPLHPARMEKHERLRAARIRAGIRSAADAARRLGVPYGTYTGHEAGSRGIKDAELRAYARAFKVPPAWLAYGEGAAEPNNVVPVMGKV